MCPIEGGLFRFRRFPGVRPTASTTRAQAAKAWAAGALTVLASAFVALTPDVAAAQNRTLELYFTHTKESIKVVYKRGGRYDPAGLRELNRFLRDWRRNESTKMDPELFDLLWEVQQEFGGKKIYVVSAYRSPATNAMLRSRSRGVAKNSQHMAGKAMDFYIPGANLSKLRAAGIKRQVGGVGYYPRSGSPFVHFDTGSVRAWPRMSYSQLARIFPDGKTLHIASNGKTLKNYAAAKSAEKSGKLASLRSSGGDGGGFSLFGFGGSGRQVAAVDTDRQRGILPQTSRAKPAPKKATKPAPKKDEPAKVRTASLGPAKTEKADDDGGGFFRQLPGASLGGLIGRFTGGKDEDDAREEDKVTPVALPRAPLTAVAIDNEDASSAGEESGPAPVPRLAPAELRASRAAGDDAPTPPEAEATEPAEAAPAADDSAAPDTPDPIELAALPPQRPEYEGIASDVATGPLAYARAGSPGSAGVDALDETTALLPTAESALEDAPLGELGAIGPGSPARSVTMVKTTFSPVRGATPLLIADGTSVEEGNFAALTPPDRVNASKGGVLLADGFLGAPATFASATNWPSTDAFQGLRITVYARPRS